MTPPPRLAVIFAAHLLTGLALLLTIQLHLLAALLAGLLVYALIDALAPLLQRRLPGTRAHVVVVALLGALIVALLSVGILGFISFLRSEIGDPSLAFEKLMPLVERARTQLPTFVVDHLPDTIDELRTTAMDAMRQHASQLQLAGQTALRGLVHVLIGIVLGAMIALSSAAAHLREREPPAPLAAALGTRARNLTQAFHDIVFAQVKISALNTVFTALFLLLVLPLFGVELPLAKTLVAATFVFGLLPVVGNLVSNTLIFVVGLSVSLGVGIAALVFLILIHKLEYFLNARIVGSQIRARAWEILVAMLFMEAAFGLAGVVAAPIYYAWLKRELAAAGLI